MVRETLWDWVVYSFKRRGLRGVLRIVREWGERGPFN
jgi:hypothetical protein